MPSLVASRRVTLVVVDGEGEVRGQLPTFSVNTPWWQDLEPILAVHPDVVVLRLLSTTTPGSVMGGEVAYLVEAERVPPRLSGVDPSLVAAAMVDDERRAPWARPGGPGADLAWAEQFVRLAGAPQQLRSWNLSSIWRLPTPEGDVWLKCVPPFFAHEAAVLRALAPVARVPDVVAAEGHRMLLAAMPGHDGYGASLDEYRQIVDVVVDLQTRQGDVVAGLRGGVPAWSLKDIAARIEVAMGDRRAQWPRLAQSLSECDAWAGELEACGLPETLFHGDLHPGNARLGVDRPIVFDWGDSGWGHPLLDMAVLERYEVDGQATLRKHWLDRWSKAVPGSDPARAWEIIRPVALARAAAVYRNFLDHIEAAERPYHESDVDPALDVAEAARDSG